MIIGCGSLLQETSSPALLIPDLQEFTHYNNTLFVFCFTLFVVVLEKQSAIKGNSTCKLMQLRPFESSAEVATLHVTKLCNDAIIVP
jgi:hypothetical protein